MSYPKKHEKSVIHSVRVPSKVKRFLKDCFSQDFTANDFVNYLIQNSDEFQEYLRKKQSEKQEPSLNFS